ncbi:MAG: RagB/SusD family nutrient uptake outer membrane protein [Cyclobacteriaceae bacterium]|nr:RagB/SusD family nutrient uptake outer membrane protein [Cyclobacteriaceae bacterium]
MASSCGDLLELTPQTALSDATAFATPERIELTVAGMYDAAQSGFYAGGAVRGYPFGAAHVEQGDNRGEDVVNTQAFFLITYSNTYDGVSGNNDFHFQTLFALVNRVNVVLAGLETAKPSATLTQAQIDAYKGEGRFLRALAYMELLKHFCRPAWDNKNAPLGGMPYRKTAIVSSLAANDATALGRATVAENYADILADLDYAESVLPNTRTGSLKVARATKAAAIALKTRVHLNLRNWAAVVTEGNKLAPQATGPFTAIGANGTYALTTSPFGPFTSGNSKSNTESIFSIENDVTDNPGVNGALPSMYNTSVAPTTGRALVAISPYIWNQTWWNASDIRKSSTMVNINVELPGGGGKGGYFTKKYSDVVGGSDNAPIIRYAEVLLNMAEAIQRQIAVGAAPDPRAFALYNAIRSRANAAGTDLSYDGIGDFANGQALITAILNERRIEFLCEGMRWMDITRLAETTEDALLYNTWGGGIPAKVSSNAITNYQPLYTGNPATNPGILSHIAIPYSNYKFLWPIPTSEVILNPTLAAQQNPGW